MADKTPPVGRVSSIVTVISLIALVVLAMGDLLNEEAVPIVVYGIIGGVAFGADKDSIPSIFGRRRDE